MLKFIALNTSIEYGFLGKKELNLESAGCKNKSSRTIVAKLIDPVLEDISLVEQKHTNDCHIITQIQSEYPIGDAQITNKKNIPLIVRTADCVPVIFIDNEKLIIGIAHAGWRGAISGVIENTVNQMIRLGSEVKSICAVIGPCIHQQSYEVDSEFYKKFISEMADNKKHFLPSIKEGRYMFALPEYCQNKMSNLGIKNIENISSDTFKNPDIWYSHRHSTKNGYIRSGDNISYVVMK